MSLRAALLAILVATGCAARDQPYRFASPMLGMADTPPPSFRAPTAPERPVGNRRADEIRVASAPRIREASAAIAAAIADAPAAQPDARASLPAPHRGTPPVLISPRVATDLRSLVGLRDKRTSLAAALAWSADLGHRPEGFTGSTGDELVTWAESAQRLADATAEAQPGDLLIFDAATSDLAADLVAVVIARDERGVTEMLYVGGGVVRRGFVDAARPHTKRDKQLGVVNSFVRHGKRWPAKGSHYLAGELLAHVIRWR